MHRMAQYCSLHTLLFAFAFEIFPPPPPYVVVLVSTASIGAAFELCTRGKAHLWWNAAHHRVVFESCSVFCVPQIQSLLFSLKILVSKARTRKASYLRSSVVFVSFCSDEMFKNIVQSSVSPKIHPICFESLFLFDLSSPLLKTFLPMKFRTWP